MRAVVCQELGPLENLELVEVSDPVVLQGHVKVRVLASGVNYVDGLLIQGKYQIKPPTPFVPGMEVVGEVVEVASDVDSLKVGERIFLNHNRCNKSQYVSG